MSMDDIIKGVEKVTAEQVQQLAQQLFTPREHFAHDPRAAEQGRRAGFGAGDLNTGDVSQESEIRNYWESFCIFPWFLTTLSYYA